jgi:hypothetical protein
MSNVDTGSAARISTLIPRLNVHHKQLFFSDNPIFVEGLFDAQMIEAIQQKRNVSITAAGSCIIDVGGCDEVNRYLELCQKLNKKAYFFYDLDSLFTGNLRQCIKSDSEVSEFLASLGLGVDFAKYCGELDRKLTEIIEVLRISECEGIRELKKYLEDLAQGGSLRDKELQRARIAVLVFLARQKRDLIAATSSAQVNDLEGRLNQIVSILRQVNVILLPGGALEHYLPSYSGSVFRLEDTAKRNAVTEEVSLLSSGRVVDLSARYGGLLESVSLLPAKPPVDTDAVLITYAADFIHQLQGLVLSQADWAVEQFNSYFNSRSSGLHRLFRISSLTREGENKFSAVVEVLGSSGTRTFNVTDETNAGMRKFVFNDVV